MRSHGTTKTNQTDQLLENDPATAPSISCEVATSSPAGVSLDVTFNVQSSVLSATDKLAIENFVDNWHVSGGTGPVRWILCTSLPRQIFSRGGCGAGTDFTHHDFQSLSGVSSTRRAAVWEADNLTLLQLISRLIWLPKEEEVLQMKPADIQWQETTVEPGLSRSIWYR